MSIGLIILLAVVAIIVIWFISSYNGFIKLKNKCSEAFSTMDVSLKKRYDLIPNLVETVKGYANHEKEALEAVVSARNSAMGATNAGDKIEKDSALTGTLRTLFAVVESYPDLKANQNFIDLQNQLSNIEEEIAGSRRYYNGAVNRFNTKIEMFPSNIIAGIFHFEKKPLYEIKDESERENVKVQF